MAVEDYKPPRPYPSKKKGDEKKIGPYDVHFLEPREITECVGLPFLMKLPLMVT